MTDVTRAPATAQDSRIQVISFKPLAKRALLGFADLALPSGMVLRDCTVMQANGKTWVNAPSKPQLDNDGKQRVDQSTGKKMYAPVVEFADKRARDRFNEQALAALQPYISGGAK